MGFIASTITLKPFYISASVVNRIGDKFIEIRLTHYK